MKKSEKVKGKEAAEARKKLQVRYGLLVAAGIIVIAVLWFVMFNPLVAKNRGYGSRILYRDTG